MSERISCGPDDIDPEYVPSVTGSLGCSRCWGEGWIVVCPDDMCRGLGECIHNDGMIACPECTNWLPRKAVQM